METRATELQRQRDEDGLRTPKAKEEASEKEETKRVTFVMDKEPEETPQKMEEPVTEMPAG